MRVACENKQRVCNVEKIRMLPGVLCVRVYVCVCALAGQRTSQSDSRLSSGAPVLARRRFSARGGASNPSPRLLRPLLRPSERHVGSSDTVAAGLRRYLSRLRMTEHVTDLCRLNEPQLPFNVPKKLDST